jgi:hypothetical protein
MASKNDEHYLKIIQGDLYYIIRLCKYLNDKYLKKQIENYLIGK